jgi:hypothetical protein
MASDNILAAGFLLIRPTPRAHYMSPKLLPANIISLSECICPRFPGPYAIDWASATEDQRSHDFDKVGLPPQDRAAALTWATGAFGIEFGWPDVFYKLEYALAARERFFREDAGIRAVGVGLPREYSDVFVEDSTPLPPKPGFATTGESGYLEVIKTNCSLPGGGTQLGYEPLGVEFGVPSHSWLCNGLEEHCFATLSVRPGQNGLLATREEAVRCCAEIDREEVGAEPGPWMPWLLYEYARTLA